MLITVYERHYHYRLLIIIFVLLKRYNLYQENRNIRDLECG